MKTLSLSLTLLAACGLVQAQEIGQVLSVTESRVCQLHAQAVGRLRTKINQLVSG